ncbi:hypothetical protein KUTeg_003774 [Tegillarca granosa]|uniref:Uncharacterized protein n=1 Tax=Tegillarca granosa TaxID=220873 RepID=A0ABQ9FN61_TEGGR|nr:hypothetical protein KUTeg_003774 [Tegillarca granosa]
MDDSGHTVCVHLMKKVEWISPAYHVILNKNSLKELFSDGCGNKIIPDVASFCDYTSLAKLISHQQNGKNVTFCENFSFIAKFEDNVTPILLCLICVTFDNSFELSINFDYRFAHFL